MRIRRLVLTINRSFIRAPKELRAVLIALAVACTLFAASTPERAKGISIHMLPKRVASLGGRKWGLNVDYSSLLKPEPEQPVIQTPRELLAFVRKQDKDVQENGVWIVTTHPDAYSEGETKLLNDIKVLCHNERIPLFISRASDLPNGWKRYD